MSPYSLFFMPLSSPLPIWEFIFSFLDVCSISDRFYFILLFLYDVSCGRWVATLGVMGGCKASATIVERGWEYTAGQSFSPLFFCTRWTLKWIPLLFLFWTA
jgi:hypothetical protein